MSNQIFISYSHGESSEVQPVIRWLRDNGFNIWFDESIRAGESWREELAIAINESTMVLFFMSEKSVSSEHCRKEIAYALDAATPILSVVLEPVDLAPGLKLALSDVQAIRANELTDQEFHDTLFSTVTRFISEHGDRTDVSHRPVTVTRSLGAHGEKSQPKSAIQPVVAVLPFANQSSDPEQVFFSDGISEEILNGLSKQKGLRTIARMSTWMLRDQNLDAREIGERLGATYLLEGSVRKAGNRVRVSAQLIETSTGNTTWSEQFQRDLVDIFDVQDDITEEILSALKLQFEPLSVSIQTTPQAYEAHLSALKAYNALDFDTAKKHAEKAIELDPSYVQPYSFVAGMNLLKVFFWFSSLKQELPTIIYFNKLALSLDKNHTVANIVRLQLEFYVEKNCESVIKDSLALLRQNPGDLDIANAILPMLISLQRYEETIDLLDQVSMLDPLSPMFQRLRAETLSMAGKYDEAKIALDQTARLGMPDPMQYGYMAFMKGDLPFLEEQLPLLNNALGEDHLYTLISQARALFLREDYEQVREILKPLKPMAEAQEFHYLLALIAQLGFEKDNYLDQLSIALEIGECPAMMNYPLRGIWAERYADVLESDRYQSILKKAGVDKNSLENMSQFVVKDILG